MVIAGQIIRKKSRLKLNTKEVAVFIIRSNDDDLLRHHSLKIHLTLFIHFANQNDSLNQ